MLFPVFLKLHELETLVIGGGYVGLEKLEAIFKNSPQARVTLCAKEILQDDIRELTKNHRGLTLIEKPFRKKYLKGKDLVIMATDSRSLHDKVKKLCRKKHILANVADTPNLCDFYLGSVVKKGDLKIAISSNGKSPTITKRIREYLEEAIPDDVQQLLDKMKEIRDQLKGDFEFKVQELNRVTQNWGSDRKNAG